MRKEILVCCRTLALTLVLPLVAGAASGGEPLVIENETLQATFDTATARFALRDKASGKICIAEGRFSAVGGAASVAAVSHEKFGAGRTIRISRPDGSRNSIALYPGLPFALFGAMLHNGGAESMILNHVPLCLAGIDLGKPLTELRAFGTGGLTTLEKNSGSYAYLAIVDPATRSGCVGGWLTHDRGSGVVFSPVEGSSVRMEARIDYGRLRIKPGQEAATETFALGWFADARLGLEAYADAITKLYSIKLPPQPAGYCTWYAEKHGGGCDEKHLVELAAFAAEKLKPFGFDFVQIDDQWQAGVSKNGPRRNFTTHRPDGPYPGGMQAAATSITRLGLTPGIWFMPFAGTHYDPFFEQHQDWFAKGPDGKPFETRWGGTCLDMTLPGPQEHLRSVVQRLAHEWGYKIFKMDGLWTGTATRLMYVNNGYQDDQIGEAQLGDPDKTHIEAFRDGLKLVRRTAGPDVFLLGCCVSQNMRSFGGAMGLVDAMRVGPDTGAGHIGAPHGSRNYFLHGRVWQNDPDCVSVRASTPLARARLNATWTAISGQLFYNSDWLPDMPGERLEILKRTIPAHGLLPRPVDLFENDPARVWLLTDARSTPRRDVVAFYNWDEAKSATISVDLRRLGLPATKYAAFDFWANKFVPPVRERITVSLPAASCRILALRPTADYPQLLSTSRHVTQGIVDVREEKWQPSSHRLTGVSRVVAGDPYELRLVVPVGDRSWRATRFEVADDDAAAGVKTRFAQDGPKLRATLTSPVSRDVRWQAAFEPASIATAPPQPVAGLTAAADYQTVKLTWQDNGADRYRVARSDGQTIECAEPQLDDAQVEHGKHYRYTVQALGWSATASPPAAVEIATPAELKRPPTPPLPDVRLSDLKPLVAKVGYGKLGVNKSIEGKPLTIEGKKYQYGLGTHANALLVYAIPSGAARFVAVVGLDDEKRSDPRASVICEVYGDVKEMGEPPALLGRSPTLSGTTIRSWTFDLPLNSRMKELRLVVTDAGDGIACDHADWVDAGFKFEKR